MALQKVDCLRESKACKAQVVRIRMRTVPVPGLNGFWHFMYPSYECAAADWLPLELV